MFETLVMTKREKTAARTALAFPVAAVFQVGLVGTLLVYSFLHIPAIQAPSLAWSFLQSDGQVVVPIQKATRTTRTEPARTEPANKGYAPNTTPDGTPPPDDADPQDPVDGDPDGVPFGMPPDPDYKPPAPPPIARPANEIRSMGEVNIPQVVHRISPEYPPPALAMRMSGRVVLEIVVNQDGQVTAARVLQSDNPVFNESALRAVRQWRYTRPIDARSNQAVSCYMTVVVNFTLR
jgi:protein TonB